MIKELKKTYLLSTKLCSVWFSDKEVYSILTVTKMPGGCPRGVMVKALDCGIIVLEFVLQLRYYVQFRANTLGKGMSPLNLPAMG